MKYSKEQLVWILLRLSMGLIFFWAFIDKLLGLGFATKPESAWLAGGSPTSGFLQFGTHGPLAGFYASLAGNVFIEWIFMIGLLGIGVALLLGIGMRIAAYSGALMMLLMYSALIPPEHHPLIDDHIVYALILLLLSYVKAGQWFGLRNWWLKQGIVKKYSVLE